MSAMFAQIQVWTLCILLEDLGVILEVIRGDRRPQDALCYFSSSKLGRGPRGPSFPRCSGVEGATQGRSSSESGVSQNVLDTPDLEM